jgi:transposase
MERLTRTRPVCFMDESGVDPRLCRRDAWTPRGETLTARVSGSQRTRTRVIGAWCQGRFLAPMMLEGRCDRHVINTYFRKVLLPVLPSGSVVVPGNARFHRASRARGLAVARGMDVLYLPSYSPDLNPIEHFGSSLKTHLRKRLSEASDKFQAVCDTCNVVCQKCTNIV